MLPEKSTDDLSRSTEDYLNAVLGLAGDGDRPVQTTSIAERLAVAAPSVSGMLRRLAEGGLLEHVPYRGVRLTTRGRRAALRVVLSVWAAISNEIFGEAHACGESSDQSRRVVSAAELRVGGHQ